SARRGVAADELRLGKPASEDPRLATAALERAFDLEPGDPGLKAELAFRTGAETSKSAGHEKLNDEQYMVAPEVFLARARANPAKKGEVVDRQLHWVRAVTYHPDKRVSQMMHYSREIVIEPRTQEDLYEKGE